MGLFFSEAPPSRLAIEVGLDRCHDLAARAVAALPPDGDEPAATGWSRPAVLLGEALTPQPDDDPRICPDCGAEAESSASTRMPGVRRYTCGWATCGRWWVA